jgi:predicted DNA-binding WGR domain protein
MHPRRFELVEGKHSKFWEVEVAGKKASFCWGRIGTAGQAKTKPFASAGDAEKAAEKLVRDKLSEGYREVGAKKPRGKAVPVAKKSSGPQRASDVVAEIAKLLAEAYDGAHQRAFAAQATAGRYGAGTSRMSLDKFREKIGAELPTAFYDLYRWAFGAAAKGEKAPLVRQGPYRILGLDDIVDRGVEWKRLQREQPHREWREGFVEIDGWSGAYCMVIDTLGKVKGKAGQVLYFDFKGGSEYVIAYKSYEAYLEEILDLLRRRRYFPAGEEDYRVADEWMDRLMSRAKTAYRFNAIPA